ncbi:hypothetical protein, partial [Burkholderia ambifaria]|uniref:hypothetical protein n=1 Tax=Burkholderia ambifaria TaxID=152480 RepID=UPI001ABAD77E
MRRHGCPPRGSFLDFQRDPLPFLPSLVFWCPAPHRPIASNAPDIDPCPPATGEHGPALHSASLVSFRRFDQKREIDPASSIHAGEDRPCR